MKNKHTAGQWELVKQKSASVPFIIKSSNIEIANMCWGIRTNTVETFEEVQANANLIAAAPKLLQMVYDLKQCIKRLSQDNLSQIERDTEAQWEGEAHELLTSINPDYYQNANAAQIS